MSEPQLKDGQALDRLIDRAERWAKHRRKGSGDLEADFEAKFRPEAEQLARQCTLPARPFGLKEWIMAVPLWLILAAIVFVGSLLLMQPEGVWLYVYAVVAVLIFVIGVGAVYVETTSEKRAEKRYTDKVEWLLSASRKQVANIVSKTASQ